MDDPPTDSFRRCLSSVLHTELEENGLNVILSGVVADLKGVRNLFVGKTSYDQLKNLLVVSQAAFPLIHLKHGYYVVCTNLR